VVHAAPPEGEVPVRIAGTASASFESLPAALITVVVFAALAGLLIVVRRRV
jgi:hypothetical protein